MTVTNTTNRVQENGNDVKVNFDFAFKIFAATDVEVYVVDNTTQVAVLQTLITDYTVAFDSEAQTGTVTYVTAPPTGSSSLIISKFPITQTTDIPTASNFPEVAIENEFDKSRLIDQQLSERIDRAVLLPVQSGLTDLEIPVSVANANKAIVVNATGDNLDVKTVLESPQVDVVTTRGDLIKGDAVGVSERLPIGANTYVLTSDGLDPSWQPIPTQPEVKMPGDTVQVVNFQTGVVASGTTQVPLDDTIPQNTEGDEYMTLAITPTSASNILEITVVGHFTFSVTDKWMIVGLFQDSTIDALASSAQQMGAASLPANITFKHRMVAGTVLSTTFKVRAGANNVGTTGFNGIGGTPELGGSFASSITIKEIQV